MKIGPTDKFWVVVDPGPESEIGDTLFETTIEGLSLQFKGGLGMRQRPAIFTDRQEAEAEVLSRLAALRAWRAIADSRAGASIGGAARVRLLDNGDQVIFEADIP